MAYHQFGGNWTEEKLSRLRKYLEAYSLIFDRNERARYFTTSYVDAFAGTGAREEASAKPNQEPMLFSSVEGDTILDDEDARSFRSGSARIALEVEPGFDRYIFVEANQVFAMELQELKRQFRSKEITVESGDANSFIKKWCASTNWEKNRAVVFLDPYGMEVEWSTMTEIAKTEAIDVWILFPLGQAVNRLLTKRRPPPETWARRLTRFFGTETWKDEFYRPSGQGKLFETEESFEKSATFESISRFFLCRLQEVFKGVSQNPLPLKNSRGVPIYLLCFAAGNPRGARPALNIANHILLP